MPFAGAAAAAAGGAAAVEVFGLNKSRRLGFGVAEAEEFATAAAPALARFPLGEVAGDAAGLAAVVAVACLRVRFAFGEAAGEAAAEDDVALSAAGAVVSAFLRARFFAGAAAGDSAGLGDWSCAIQTPANAITESRATIFVVIARRLRKSEH